MCYFYLNSYSPSPSKGCNFVAKWEWGPGVVGEGSRGSECEVAPRKDKLRVFHDSGCQSPGRISPSEPPLKSWLEWLKGHEHFQHFPLCFWPGCLLCLKLIKKIY